MQNMPNVAELDAAIADKLSAIKNLEPAQKESALKSILGFLAGLEIGQNFRSEENVRGTE